METEESTGPPRAVLLALGAVLLIVAVLLVAALTVPLQPPPPKVTPKSGIIMPNGAANSQLNFSPPKVTVVIGVNNTVQWTNDDSTDHTVKSESVPSGAQPFASSVLANGQTFSVTLTVPGTYTYECTLHPLWMQGTIIVVASSGSG